MDKREQVLILIESELISSKLIVTLKDINVDASDYITDISQVIFDLLDIGDTEENEELLQKYFDLLQQVRHINVFKTKDRQKMVSKCYEFLLANK